MPYYSLKKISARKLDPKSPKGIHDVGCDCLWEFSRGYLFGFAERRNRHCNLKISNPEQRPNYA